MWKKVLREYFAFPKKERRGLLFLFFIWIILLIYRLIIFGYADTLYKPELFNLIPGEEFVRLSDSLENRPEELEETYKFIPKRIDSASINDLVFLGIEKYKAKILLKYINSGGIISSSEQLSKVYSLKEKDVEIILKNFTLQTAPYINKNFNNDHSSFEKKIISKLDINTVDSIELRSIYGIGPVLSKRISTYRDRLGGFINYEQFREIFGIDSQKFEVLKSKVQILGKNKKININKASLDELKNHPYIGFRLARIIINYRDQHGAFKNVESLKNIKIMDEEIFIKLEPYIFIENDSR